MANIFVTDPRKGRIKAGVVNGDGFVKTVIKAKHFLRVVNGYAIQASLFDELTRLGVEHIIIKETDTGDNYCSSVADWFEHGGKWTKGHGEQRTLSLKYMTKR